MYILINLMVKFYIRIRLFICFVFYRLPFLSMWFIVLQLDMFNQTLMEFSDRQSDFGPPIPSGGVWVNNIFFRFNHSSTAMAVKVI